MQKRQKIALELEKFDSLMRHELSLRRVMCACKRI